MYYDALESAMDWCDEGPYRFYFTETYNPRTYQFGEVPYFGKKVGYSGKSKGVFKGLTLKV